MTLKINVHPTQLNCVDESALFEMSNKWKSSTGLPMNIWIDENREYITGKHWKRVKFQLDTSNKMDINNSAPMGLDGEVKVDLPKHIGLTPRDIEELRNWVLNNNYALSLVADTLVPLDDIFPYMIKGGKRASAEDIAKLNAKVDELRIDRS